jgi:cbb3-type cytochrome oxidase subunit 3
MYLLEYLAVGLFYLPFLAIPFIMLFWYAFVSNRRNERDQAAKQADDEYAESQKR